MMEKDLRQRLFAGDILLCDGAMGTELQRYGLPPTLCSDAWNLLRPDLVLHVHRQYAAAGAQCLLTNTLSSNRVQLARYGLQDRLKETIAAAVRLAVEATAGRAFVLGCLGPVGIAQSGTARGRAQSLRDTFAESASLLACHGIDGFLLETFSDMTEAETAVLALRSVSSLPILVSFVFARTDAGLLTLAGATPREVAHFARSLGVDAVGCNCGVDLDGTDYEILVREIATESGLPVLVEPSVDDVRPASRGGHAPLDPHAFARFVRRWRCAGARLIGGCCGTTPEHIAAAAAVLRLDGSGPHN